MGRDGRRRENEGGIREKGREVKGRKREKGEKEEKGGMMRWNERIGKGSKEDEQEKQRGTREKSGRR